MLQRAGIARFYQALVKCVHGHSEVIEKDPAHERKREVAAGLRERASQLRTVHKSRRIKKHGGPEQSLNRIDDEWNAIGSCDHQVAPEIQPQFAPAAHCVCSLWLKSSKCSRRWSFSNNSAVPVSWKNACSRLAVWVRASKPATVSSAASCP